MEFCLNPAETVYRSLMRETPLFGAIGCYKSHLQPALEKLFFWNVISSLAGGLIETERRDKKSVCFILIFLFNVIYQNSAFL